MSDLLHKLAMFRLTSYPERLSCEVGRKFETKAELEKFLADEISDVFDFSPTRAWGGWIIEASWKNGEIQKKVLDGFFSEATY